MVSELEWLKGYKIFLRDKAKIIDEGVFKEIDDRIAVLTGENKNANQRRNNRRYVPNN